MSDEKGLSDKEYVSVSAAGQQIRGVAFRFPEIRGLCRTCSSAHIFRRQYSEVPTLFCQAFDISKRMPLDIMECSRYSRRGELRMDELAEMAILIDGRDAGGQYL